MCRKILVVLVVVLIGVPFAYSFESNSTNYMLFPTTISDGGGTSNSDNYRNQVSVGSISGESESSTYKNLLGFFRSWLLADGQSCTAGSQCQGGFCCSNTCSSSPCPTPSGGGGGGAGSTGGGGGGIALEEEEEANFIITPQNIREKIALGESSERTVRIRNTGGKELSINLDIESLEEFVFLSKDEFGLQKAGDVEITLNFAGKEVGSFPGELVARAGGLERTIAVILEVISEKVLFDVELDIPSAYSQIREGEGLKSQITILNVGAPEKVDVFATYHIKDLRGNIVYEEKETFAVEEQVSFPKTFALPEKMEEGRYVAIIEVRYVDSFAVSSQIFEVVKKKSVIENIQSRNILIMSGLAIILLVFLLLFTYARVPKKKRKSRK